METFELFARDTFILQNVSQKLLVAECFTNTKVQYRIDWKQERGANCLFNENDTVTCLPSA